MNKKEADNMDDHKFDLADEEQAVMFTDLINSFLPEGTGLVLMFTTRQEDDLVAAGMLTSMEAKESINLVGQCLKQMMEEDRGVAI
jgi:hypothetical protein